MDAANERLGVRILRGFSWTIVGTLFSRAFILLSSVLVARIVGRVEFGSWGMVISTVTTLASIPGLGFGLAGTRYVAQYCQHRPMDALGVIRTLSRATVVTGTLMALVMAAFPRAIASGLLNDPELTGVVRISSPCLLLFAIAQTQTGILAGLEEFRRIAVLSALSAFICIPLTVSGALLGGVGGAVLGTVCGAAVGVEVNRRVLNNRLSVIERSGDEKRGKFDARALVSYVLPSVLCNVVFNLTMWCCNVILVRQANGYAEMGVLTAVTQWKTAVFFIPGLLSGVMVSILSRLQSGRDVREYGVVLRYNLLTAGFGAAIVAAPVVLLAPVVMGLYGSDFVGETTALHLVCFTGVIMAVLSPIGNGLASAGLMWHALSFNLLWAITLLAFAWVLRSDGATGIAMAGLIAYGVQGVFMLGIARRNLGKRRGSTNTESPTRNVPASEHIEAYR